VAAQYLLRPLFAKNHYWTMDRGEKHIADLIRRRRSEQR
jgi:hypothetical protein